MQVIFRPFMKIPTATGDRFHFPLPFGRGVFLWGEPIEIERELDEVGLEHARLLVEARMNELGAEADRRVGHGAPLAPAVSPPPMGLAGRERR